MMHLKFMEKVYVSLIIFMVLGISSFIAYRINRRPELICHGDSLEKCKLNAFGCHDKIMQATNSTPLPASTESIWVDSPEEYFMGQGEWTHRIIFTIKDRTELEDFIFKLTSKKLMDLPDHPTNNYTSNYVGGVYKRADGNSGFPWHIDKILNGRFRVENYPPIVIDVDRSIIFFVL